MLIFENGLRIVFENGLLRYSGIIKSQSLPVNGNIKYRVDVYEFGKLSNTSIYILEKQILQVYIKDIFGHDIWVKVDDLYASYPNGTIIRPDTILKRHMDGNSFSKVDGLYEYAKEYLANDEKAVKTAMWKWKITPKKVIFNGPATIVMWEDGTKTIVKKSENDTDDREKAVMYAILKKEFGSRAKMNRYLKQFLKEVESNEEKAD
jgi:hypothetical protein